MFYEINSALDTQTTITVQWPRNRQSSSVIYMHWS